MGAEEARLRELLAGWEAVGAEAGSADALVNTAREILAGERASWIPSNLWHRYLDRTRRSDFLRAVSSRELRFAWAEATFDIVVRSGYTLETMLRQRVASHPRRNLFRQLAEGERRDWSYDMVSRQLRAIATALLLLHEGETRVAIVSENSLESATCDLACLVYEIFVTPLNPHFGEDVLAGIIDRLRINTVVTHSPEQRARLERVRRQVKAPFRLLLLDPEASVESENDARLAELCTRLGREQIERTIAERPRRDLRDVLTVMFTSGSTGFPKGVEYSAYNLITKRFARAAAVPAVGDEEVFLCYLPLYHTFGRYLEMMGSLFWGGTYVFTGNPSFETLLKGLGEVRPTVLISIPRRWEQIRDRCLKSMSDLADGELQERAFRRLTGGRLLWGLSAAGHLDPSVFHFFQRHGVDLCSGFGMTEATGGITMTPPGEYEDETVGVPLPGLDARLSPEGELQISGHYIARYLDDGDVADVAEAVPAAEVGEEEPYWLSTGDIFQQRESGYYEIVDRVKDIYKNSKGQTIAPGAVEHKYEGVPGIARTFLVGDGRDFNVLLIVPDAQDTILQSSPYSPAASEYFQQIIAAANEDLAPFERVVNFAVLDRDFDPELGELTAKGSLQRRVIEEHFSAVIDRLYQRDFVAIEHGELRARIPRWLFRDLGILETDIVDHPDGLCNRRSDAVLPLASQPGSDTVRIGDLEYRIAGDVVDLGLFARQPLLWVGNPSLIGFCPCKEGWDLPLGGVEPRVFLPPLREGAAGDLSLVPSHVERDLARVTELCNRALFAEAEAARDAVRELGDALSRQGLSLGHAVRRRLEALSQHPDFELRCQAYQVLLLDDPLPDHDEVQFSFVLSGLPFLSERSIREISSAKVEPFRLEVFHKRLRQYRQVLTWPASPQVRRVFDDVFRLLANFARENTEYYSAVRAELVCWILHEADPELAELAGNYFDDLAVWFEEQLATEFDADSAESWEGKLVFATGITDAEIERLNAVLVGTTFLAESILLAFDGERVEIGDVRERGIWITRILSTATHHLYRVSVNTAAGKHFDLLLSIRLDLAEEPVEKTYYWMIALHGQSYARPVLPRFGCSRTDLGALSLAYVSDLTVWERLRELAGGLAGPDSPEHGEIRNLFVRGMSAFFIGWEGSGRRIVPGLVTPANVVVPTKDYRPGVKILSLAGWQAYEGPLSIVRPLLESFFSQTLGNYPQYGRHLQLSWLFDACVEALGLESAKEFLTELQGEIGDVGAPCIEEDPADLLADYLRTLLQSYYFPRPLRCAIEHYAEWESVNPQATPEARAQFVERLMRLYLPDSSDDMARYHLFRSTYYAHAPEVTLAAFDLLLDRMFQHPEESPTHMVELADLQSTLVDAHDRLVFSRLVYPRIPADHPLDVLKVGRREHRHSVVSSGITDDQGKTYAVREPIEPAEIGRLYRIMLDLGLPVSVTAQHRYLVVRDREEQVVGGVCYKLQELGVAQLDGLAVVSSLRASHLREEVLSDFCARMSGEGVGMISTHLVDQEFFLAHGFQVDERWGGLVRFLIRPH